MIHGKKRKIQLKNKTLTIIKYSAGIIIGLAIILFISTSPFFFPREEKILAPPLKKPEEVVYNTYEVKQSSLVNTITCRGHFVPEKQVEISFKNRDGYLKAIYVTAGDMVKKGRIIAALDTDTLENEIQKQALVLEGSEETCKKLKEISVMDIEINRMELEALKKNLDVQKKLQGNISEVEIDKLEREVEIREQMYTKAVLEYQYQVSAAEREVDMARLRLRELEIELAKSTMRSPISGLVTYVAYLNEGEFIPAYKVVVSVADPDRLILQYKGIKYEYFRLGMNVAVFIHETKYNGEIILTPYQVPSEDFEKMRETIQVRVFGIPGTVELDDFATIEATLDRADNVIVLPKRLVHKYLNRTFVKILENGIVNERDIKTGIDTQTEYEITSGLEPGELVVE